MNYWSIVGDNVIQSLKYMLFGMVGIFIITIVIIGCTVALNKFTAAYPHKEGQDKNEGTK